MFEPRSAILTRNLRNVQLRGGSPPSGDIVLGLVMEQQTQETEQTALDLAALKERCMGNLALVERILAKVAGQLDADLSALERAIESRNAEQAAKLAHRIKGTAGSISARHLYLHATLAEQRAHDQPLDDLAIDLARMRSDRLEIVEAIERFKISHI